MRVKVAIPEKHVSKPVLDAALESVTRLNEQMLATGEIPSFERGLRYGVKWRPEPPGDEHFDSADRVMRRKMGDCDDLAPWQAASLRHSGEDPGAEAVVRRSGPKRWHAVVQRSDGSIDDPSLRAGMGPGVAPMPPGVMGAVLPMMLAPGRSEVGAYLLRPQIAMREHYGQVQARADLPWNWRQHVLRDPPSSTDIAMTALHTAPVASTALTGAIQDVCILGATCGEGIVDPDHIDRLCAIADACEGASFDDLCGIYGEQHARAAQAVVGSFFGKLGKLAKGAAKGIARTALPMAASFVPGGSAALRAGKGLLRGSPHRPPVRAAQQVSPPAAARDAPPSPFAAVEPDGSGRGTTIVHFH
jgi:hypothetical protein